MDRQLDTVYLACITAEQEPLRAGVQPVLHTGACITAVIQR